MASMHLLGYFHIQGKDLCGINGIAPWWLWTHLTIPMEWYDTFEKFYLPKDYSLLCVIEPLNFRIGKDCNDHLSIGHFLFNLDHSLVK